MTTDLSLLSICIPAYNRPTWLRRGLESIAESWGEGVEVIITDDSDHPGTEEIVKEVLGRLHYRYEYHRQTLGMAQNWNRAVSLAPSKYVMILHDDDFFLPGGVGHLLAALLTNKRSISRLAIARYRYVGENCIIFYISSTYISGFKGEEKVDKIKAIIS